MNEIEGVLNNFKTDIINVQQKIAFLVARLGYKLSQISEKERNYTINCIEADLNILGVGVNEQANYSFCIVTEGSIILDNCTAAIGLGNSKLCAKNVKNVILYNDSCAEATGDSECGLILHSKSESIVSGSMWVNQYSGSIIAREKTKVYVESGLSTYLYDDSEATIPNGYKNIIANGNSKYRTR